MTGAAPAFPSHVAVLGAGAVGCYYGGMLARAGHEVVLIGRAQHVAAVRRDGLLLDAVSSQVLADHAGMSMAELTSHAYVRYSEAAVEHLFSVTSGLDSAVIGEQQVLGQVRRAYAAAEAGRGGSRRRASAGCRTTSSASASTSRLTT